MRRIQRVEVVVNLASGSVGPEAPGELEALFAEAGLTPRVCAPHTDELDGCLRAAVDAGPDLLVVLAGDGTARNAAQLCGPDGPLLAPLAGGTMNVLPHAIYGTRPWQEALRLILDSGREKPISGGEVEGHVFMVAALLGAPALWGLAREAARYGDRRLALRRARHAFRRAFTGRLRYILDQGPREKAEALVLMCPMASRRMDGETPALEAAALDVHGAAEAFRLGFHALTGDWRDDPAVEVDRCQVARVWAAQGIPALLDGEPLLLRPLAEVRYVPKIVQVAGLPEGL